VSQAAAEFEGRAVPVGHFKLFILDISEGPRVKSAVIKEPLAEFMKSMPNLSPELYAEKVRKFLRNSYVEHKINVFVFAEGFDHTRCLATKGWCQIKKI
jgi:hypothetical protein